MQSCNLVVSVSLLACIIAENKTENEISLLGSIFSQLGDTLGTIAAQKTICSSDNNE